LKYYETLSQNISDIYLEKYKNNTLSYFLESGNINKKTIKTTQKDIDNYKDISDNLSK
jgi:hypothetical protein